jgi:hypothetical protein
MSTEPEVSESPAIAELRTLTTRALQTLEAIRSCHQALSELPSPKGERERELARLVEERDALAQQLGDALMSAMAAGARPSFGEAASEREPVLPFPVPAAPVAHPDADPPPLERPDPQFVSEQMAPNPSAALGGFLDRLGRPERATDPAAAHRTIVGLLRVSEDPDAWLVHAQPTQQAIVGLLAAIARHLQDEGPALDEDDEARLRAWFSRMTSWSRTYRPGYVRGLSRQNDPDQGSWFEDAEQWWWRLKILQQGADPDDVYRPGPPGRVWSSGPGAGRPREEENVASVVEALWALEVAVADPARDLEPALAVVADAGVGQRDPRLVRILVPHADRLADVPGFKTLKAAVKEQARPEESEEVDDDDRLATVVPPTWPGFARTEGRRAVIVGGDRRPAAAERIRAAFRLAEVEWEETDPRRVASVAGRIRAGSVDLLILLRAYLRHADSDVLVEACKDADVPFVVVDAGYGVSQVKLAIERYLRPALQDA